MDGYICLHRKMMNWEWYTDPHTMCVFIHILFLANYEDKNWKGMTIHRGECFTSYSSIAQDLKLSVKNVRTSINHLKSTGEVATKQMPKGLVIQVLQYDVYQKVADKTATKWQASGRQVATTNKDNKENNNKNSNSVELQTKTKFIPPTVEEVEGYVREKGYHVDAERFVLFYQSKGWMIGKNRMKNWHSAVSTWEKGWKERNPVQKQDDYDPYWGLEHYD